MRIFFPLIAIVFICACFETGGGAAATGAAISEGVDESVDIDSGAESLDTPPLAGPGETDVQVAVPIPQIDCRAATDYECLRLYMSREPLCSFIEGQTIEWSETDVATVEAMSDGPTVDLFIEKEGVAGYPTIAELGLTITPGDADLAAVGYQLPVEADGTVKFHFKAGTEAGVYQIQIRGTLGNVLYWAVGSIVVREAADCVNEALAETMADGEPPVLRRVEDPRPEPYLLDPNSLEPVDEEGEDDTIRFYYLDPAIVMDHIIEMKTEDETEPAPPPRRRKTQP